MAKRTCSIGGTMTEPRSACVSSICTSVIPPSEQRLFDVRPPQVRLRRGDPAQTVRAHPKPPFDHDGPDPLGELELDRRHDRPFVLADGVLRPRLGEAEGFADHLQQFQRNAGLLAELAQRRGTHPREAIEGGRIEVRERKRSVADRGGHPVERHAGVLQVPDPSSPAHVTGREQVSRAGRQDPEFDQPVEVVGVDPGPLGDLLP
jgi:hypothetical protein